MKVFWRMLSLDVIVIMLNIDLLRLLLIYCFDVCTLIEFHT